MSQTTLQALSRSLQTTIVNVDSFICARQKTVPFPSHLSQEVMIVCSRLLNFCDTTTPAIDQPDDLHETLWNYAAHCGSSRNRFPTQWTEALRLREDLETLHHHILDTLER